MKWVYPEFLFALAILAIPILIHLFNFRRFKKVAFTNVRFLREVKQETQSRSKLKHLLVLLMRLLAFAFLVFAFAQPYIPGEGKALVGEKAVSFYLDNSFSMNAESSDGRLFEIAKQSIAEKVNDYNATDKFQLITNDFEGRHQRLVNREEFIELLDEVKISPAAKNISEVLIRQFDVLKQSEAVSRQSFLFSDFQKTITYADQFPTDTSVQVVCIPLEAQEKDNVYIDSVWFGTPVRQINQQEELNIRVVNTGETGFQNIPLKLFINDQQKALGSFNIEPNSSIDTVLFYTNTTPGIQNARVSITDHPITFDDEYYFSYKVADQIPVLSINSGATDTSGGPIGAIFRNDAFFRFQQSSDRNVDYSRLAEYNLIVVEGLSNISSGLAQELTKFTENGGSVCIIPGSNSDINSYNAFFGLVNASSFTRLDTANSKVVKINLEHPVYQNVFERIPDNIDLPIAFKHYAVQQTIRSSQEALLRLQNGDPFLAQYEYGKGKIYIASVSVDPSFGNMARHAVFVTSLLRMAELSLPNEQLFYVIGRDEAVEVPNFGASGEHTFRIKDPGSDYEFIAEHRNFGGRTSVLFHQQIRDAGNYELHWNEQVMQGLGFNFARKESDLSTYTTEELEQQFKDNNLTNYTVLSTTVSGGGLNLEELNETRLWKWCVIAVLIFLGLEVLLIRVLKG